MFYRGQKVKVIKSISSGKTHPLKGDIGYLNNMFLFPREKFILIDLFIFFSKGKERKPEKKKFVLDLGMSNKLRSEISFVGVNKLFFVSKPHVCLNPTSLHFINNFVFPPTENEGTVYYRKRKQLSDKVEVSIPQLIGTYGIWDKLFSKASKRHRNKHNKKNKIITEIPDGMTKIPYGEICGVFTPSSIMHISNNEFKAWISSLHIIIATILHIIPDRFMSNLNHSCITSASYEFLEEFFINSITQQDNIKMLSISEITNQARMNKMISSIAFFRSLHYTAIERMYNISLLYIKKIDKNSEYSRELEHIFSNGVYNNDICKFIDLKKIGGLPEKASKNSTKKKSYFKSYFQANASYIQSDIQSNLVNGVNSLIDRVDRPEMPNIDLAAILITLTNYFFRALFYDNDTYNRLKNIQEYIPHQWLLLKTSLEIDKAKIDADGGSAALSRIFDIIDKHTIKKGGSNRKNKNNKTREELKEFQTAATKMKKIVNFPEFYNG